jgi:hypothetical protein
MRELHALGVGQAALQALPWALVIGAAMVTLAMSAWFALRRTPWLVGLVVLLFVPVLAVGFLGELTGVGYRVRYVIWAAIPLILWLGTGLARTVKQWPVRVSAVVLLLAFGTALHNRHFVDRYKNEDARSLARYLQSVSDRKSPVFVTSGYMSFPVRYYLDESWEIFPLPDVGDEPDAVDKALAILDNALFRRDYVWLVYSRPFHGDPAGRFRRALAERGALEFRTAFAGIVLYCVQSGPLFGNRTEQACPQPPLQETETAADPC